MSPKCHFTLRSEDTLENMTLSFMDRSVLPICKMYHGYLVPAEARRGGHIWNRSHRCLLAAI